MNKRTRPLRSLILFALSALSVPSLAQDANPNALQEAPAASAKSSGTDTHAVVRVAPDDPKDSPFLMNSGHHAKRTCGETKDRGYTLACIMWINGASQGYGWTKSLSPKFLPDFCPKSINFNLGERRKIFISYLDKLNDAQLSEPAIFLFRQAMAAAYPCTE